jgi:ParB/RepB/Spo0J family partition protein
VANPPTATGTETLLQQRKGMGPLSDLGPKAQVVLKIDVGLIDPNPHQPRKVFDEEKLHELAANIAEIGQLEPILVEAHPQTPGRWYIIAGERRVRAIRLNGGGTVKALEHSGVTDGERRTFALAENSRENLAAIEEADGVKALLEAEPATYRPAGKLDHDKLAKRTGFGVDKVKRLLQLAAAPEVIRRALTEGITVRRMDDNGEPVLLREETDESGKKVKVYKQKTMNLQDQSHALALLPLARHLEVAKPTKWKVELEKHVATVLEEGWGTRRIEAYVARVKDRSKTPVEDVKAEAAPDKPDAASTNAVYDHDEARMRLTVRYGKLDKLGDAQRNELRGALKMLLDKLG